MNFMFLWQELYLTRGLKTWVEHLKLMLEKTQTEAYVEFASMHPEIPYHVLPFITVQVTF